MNPYPLSALNHFTVPVAMDESPPPLLRNGAEEAPSRIRWLARYVRDPSSAGVGTGHTTLRRYRSPMLPRRPGRALGVGIQLPEVEREVRWPEYRAIARTAEDVGFDSVWVGDHLLYRDADGAVRGPWEAWTTLAGLA